jgi:hypothetical protein
MRADVLVGPSPWVTERLGPRAAGELWTKIPEALSTAIARAVNIRSSSPTITDRLLANPRWPLPYEELVVYLGNLPGAEVVRLPRCVYQLVVIDGNVVVPWCYGQSGAVSMRDARPGRSFGRLAADLLRRFGYPRRRAERDAPLLRDEIDERDVAQIGAALARLDPTPKILIAGYAGTFDHGLLRTCLGEPTLDENGVLTWRHVDDLPLPPPAIPRPRRLRFP